MTAGFFRNRFYTPSAAAAILGVSRRTVARYMKDGSLPVQYILPRRPRIYGAYLAQTAGLALEKVPVAGWDEGGLYCNAVYSIKRAAAVLSVSARSVVRLLHDALASFSVGRARRVYGASLARLAGLPLDSDIVPPALPPQGWYANILYSYTGTAKLLSVGREVVRRLAAENPQLLLRPTPDVPRLYGLDLAEVLGVPGHILPVWKGERG
ncbi:MAG TPA: hypothetical protein EYP77_08390 [Anaerolineae bacterium]|nr:hypothetical protein [Anaerolineae bacterium]